MITREGSIAGKLKYALSIGAVVALGVVLGLIGAEVYARIMESGDQPWLEPWAFWLTQPPPYRDAPYFSREFLSESHDSFKPPMVYLDSHLATAQDFRGRWVNVIDHNRVTVGQPKKFKNRIIMVGSSTLFSVHVPDEFTIASQLQKLLNFRYPETYAVINLSVPSINSNQVYMLVRSIQKIDDGDIIITYSGPDIYDGLVRGNMIGSHFGAKNTADTIPVIARRIYIEHLLPLAPWLASVRRLQRWNYTRLPAHIEEPATANALADLASRLYAWNILKSAYHVHSLGGVFFYFASPSIFDLKQQSAYKKYLITNPLLTPPGTVEAYSIGSSYFGRTIDVTKGLGIKYIDDFSNFAGEFANKEIFLDAFHVNHDGNIFMAHAIFDRLVAEEFGSHQSHVDMSQAVKRLGALPAPPIIPAASAGDYTLYSSGPQVIAVPRVLGHVWWKDLPLERLPGVVAGNSVDEVVSRLTKKPQ